MWCSGTLYRPTYEVEQPCSSFSDERVKVKEGSSMKQHPGRGAAPQTEWLFSSALWRGLCTSFRAFLQSPKNHHLSTFPFSAVLMIQQNANIFNCKKGWRILFQELCDALFWIWGQSDIYADILLCLRLDIWPLKHLKGVVLPAPVGPMSRESPGRCQVKLSTASFADRLWGSSYYGSQKGCQLYQFS